MNSRATKIYSRWWTVPVRLVTAAICGMLLYAVYYGVSSTAEPIGVGGWVALLMFCGSVTMGLAGSLLGLNSRLEIDRDGFSILGLVGRRHFAWSEIVEIGFMSNYKVPGYHVAIRVDGSRNPKVHPLAFWNSTYRVPPGMEMGGIELSRYLARRWRQWQRRAGQSGPTTLEATP